VHGGAGVGVFVTVVCAVDWAAQAPKASARVMGTASKGRTDFRRSMGAAPRVSGNPERLS
jgi:hypothetical protein